LQSLARRKDTASNRMPFPRVGWHCWSKM
jgi:hypothetical protein